MSACRYFEGLKHKISIIVITAVTVVIALMVFMAVGGQSWIHTMISTEDWAEFKIPTDVLPLPNAEFKVSSESVTICNRSTERWSNLLAQIDGGYLAEVESLSVGECKEIPIEKFARPSWKRLPAYRGLKITKVELLASVLRRAYTSQQVSITSRR